MTKEERLSKVADLITATEILLYENGIISAKGLIQTARLIASQSDEFLEANKSQIEHDWQLAARFIKRKLKGE